MSQVLFVDHKSISTTANLLLGLHVVTNLPYLYRPTKPYDSIMTYSTV